MVVMLGIICPPIQGPGQDKVNYSAKIWRGALCVEMGFYKDISWESRLNVGAHLYEILLVFEVPYQPRVKGLPGKS